MRQEGSDHLPTGVGGLAAVCRAPGLIPQGGRLRKREAARVSTVGPPAERGRRRLGEVVGGGKRGEQAARADGAHVPQRRAMLGKDDIELADELTQVVLALPHQPGPQAGQFAQTLDLVVGDEAAFGRPGAQEPCHHIGIDVIGLGFPTEDIAVAARLQRVEEQHSIPGLDEGGLEILPVVPGRFEPDQRRGRDGSPRLERAHQVGEALLRGRNGEARSDRFAIGSEHAHSVGMQSHIDADTIWGGHASPRTPRRRRFGIRRTDIPDHRVGMTWSLTMRDGGAPPPGILDKCC